MSLTFNDKIEQYSKKQFGHIQNWKKIRALMNYSQVVDDRNTWEALEFLVRFLSKGFLWESQEMLLNDILAYYGIDYAKWWAKDAWVKMQVKNGLKKGIHANQYEIWFEELERERIDRRYKNPVWSRLEPYKLVNLEKIA